MAVKAGAFRLEDIPLNGVRFINGQIGYAVGEWGIILRTADEGVTWVPQTSSTSCPLYDVFPFDDIHRCAVGDGVILKSTR